MRALETAVGAIFAPPRFSLVRISIRDLVADGKSLVRNSGVGGGGDNRILIQNQSERVQLEKNKWYSGQREESKIHYTYMLLTQEALKAIRRFTKPILWTENTGSIR